MTHMDEPAPQDGTETYTEVRLAGQPDGDYPYYDLTYRDGDKRADDLRAIWAKIRSGEYPWTDARLLTRQVTITPWIDASGRTGTENEECVEWRVTAEWPGEPDFEFTWSPLRGDTTRAEASARKFIEHFSADGPLRNLKLVYRTVTMTPWEDTLKQPEQP